jgi:hypothetical protein
MPREEKEPLKWPRRVFEYCAASCFGRALGSGPNVGALRPLALWLSGIINGKCFVLTRKPAEENLHLEVRCRPLGNICYVCLIWACPSFADITLRTRKPCSTPGDGTSVGWMWAGWRGGSEAACCGCGCVGDEQMGFGVGAGGGRGSKKCVCEGMLRHSEAVSPPKREYAVPMPASRLEMGG